MKLRATKEHFNEYGTKHRKAEGDEYDVQDDTEARRLIKLGYVEEVSGDSKNRGTAGTGSSSKRAS